MIDVSSLVIPILEEAPCGQDMRVLSPSETVYFSLREERFKAREIEKKQALDESFQIPTTNWRRIYDLCIQILQKESKDLQVVCWLAEALLRLEGFKGLAQGFDLSIKLINAYWEDLFPQSDGDIPDAKISCFIGLNGDSADGSLIFPILNTPITHGKTVEPYSTWEVNRLLKETNQENLQRSIQETSKDFFVSLYEDIHNCLDQVNMLEDILIKKLPHDAPSFLIIKSNMTLCLDTLKSIAGSFIVNKTSDITPKEGSDTEAENPSQKNITDRTKAFQTLQEIAAFFERTEPQSFLPYIIRKVVRWGTIPLPHLLTELIEDDRTLKNIFTLSGIELDENI
jgi:type VI secretion system protein ImpA